MKCEDLRNSFVSGVSHWQCSGEPGSSQCYYHLTDSVLRFHRMLVTKLDLLSVQRLRLPSRLLWLVLSLHLFANSHFVRLSVLRSETCYTPNYLGKTFFWYGWFYHFTVVLAFTNSCINPFIYAAKYREFQQGVKRLMSKLKLNQQ